MERLAAGDPAEAERLLDQRYQLYAPIADEERRAPGMGEGDR